MFRSPENRIPNPIRMFPMLLALLNLKTMIRTIPAISATGASVEGWKIFKTEEAPASTSRRRMIWPVTVVPTLAPIMIPRD